MHGDFSRLSFALDKHYSAVLFQQGRVSLDADANEHTAILLHHLRRMAADVFGPSAGPADAAGFEIGAATTGQLADLSIGIGRYWVDGVLCEVEPAGWNDDGTLIPPSYYQQPDRRVDPEDADERLPAPPFLVYLRVFERLVTAVEDPAIRELALGGNGPDTAARSKVVWQVHATTKTPGTDDDLPNGLNRETILASWRNWAVALRGGEPGKLKAGVAKPDGTDDDPCITPPELDYRGGNQLYRVEIHRGGPAGTATYKWSRENASVALPIESLDGNVVTVTSLGRDGRLDVQVDDVVEIVDDAYALGDGPARLHLVREIDPLDRRVVLERAPQAATGRDPDLHPLLRRWDHPAPAPEQQTDYALQVKAPEKQQDRDIWLDLDQGIQIAFPRGGSYRRGDFWLIPARRTGTIQWPEAAGAPAALPPHGRSLPERELPGVQRSFAPLALVNDLGAEGGIIDLRCEFDHLPCGDPSAAEGTEETVEQPADTTTKRGGRRAQPAEATRTGKRSRSTTATKGRQGERSQRKSRTPS